MPKPGRAEDGGGGEDVEDDEAEPEAERVAVCDRIRGALASGRLDLALREADMAMEKFSTAGNRKGVASACLMQARIRASVEDHDLEDTLEASQAAMTALQAVGDTQGELEALRLMLEVQIKRHQFDAASKLAKKILLQCSSGADGGEVAAAHLALADVLLQCANRGDAIQSVREALKMYQDLDQAQGKAKCRMLLSRIHFQSGEFEDCVDEAMQVCELAGDDWMGEASANYMISMASAALGEHVKALRAAERAGSLWRSGGDLHSEVDALILQAEAKMNIYEEREEKTKNYASHSTILKSAERAVSAARSLRSADRACIAAASYTYARVLLRANALKGAWLAAKGAARAFRKLGDTVSRARAMLVWSEADLLLGYFEESRGNAQAALAAFDKADHMDGKAKAVELTERIDRALGIPTQAELAEQQRQQLEYQQNIFLQQQMQMQAQMPTMLQQSAVEESSEIVAASPGAFKRDGASPLQVSKDMDLSVVRGKILDVAIQIIGDAEGVDGDTPLMEAGLTSNTAVILRDELSKDLPGIKLPPTLIFDYPSIGAIADFVLESSK
mmetsp:Transcript_3923/g.9528  ORF Transcript_3923/g.9528 Transcript_3923/m.9528 type:complete len:563 (-) Transcript_3923:117-1805(-)